MKQKKKIFEVIILIAFAAMLGNFCNQRVSISNTKENKMTLHIEQGWFIMEQSELDVERYFIEMLPELEAYASYIERESEGAASLTYYVCQTDEGKPNAEDNVGYYIYVGEQWDDHRVNWDWFFVKADLSEIYYYDIVDGGYWTLEEWRMSEGYRSLK